MSISDEITVGFQEGKSEQEVAMALQKEGYTIKEIEDAFSQMKIKMAVNQNHEPEEYQNSQEYNSGMQQSVMNDAPQEQTIQPPQEVIPEKQDAFSQYQQFQQQYQQQPQAQVQQNPPQQQYYSQDQQQYDNTNADVISEIAEQVVTEKLSSLRNSLEAVYNLKNSFETKISILDDRLKKIEKIIDRLQLSVLQKVGDYLTNVEDIKKELIETQKTFKSVMGQNNNQK